MFVGHDRLPYATSLGLVVDYVLGGERWGITARRGRVRRIEVLTDRIHRPDFTLDGPFHLACRLFELVGERYLPILDDLDTQILDLEEGAIDGDTNVLPDIHALRRDIAFPRRSLAPQPRLLEVVPPPPGDPAVPAARAPADPIDNPMP